MAAILARNCQGPENGSCFQKTWGRARVLHVLSERIGGKERQEICCWSVINVNDHAGTTAVVTLKQGRLLFWSASHNFELSLSGLTFLKDYL